MSDGGTRGLTEGLSPLAGHGRSLSGCVSSGGTRIGFYLITRPMAGYPKGLSGLRVQWRDANGVCPVHVSDGGTPLGLFGLRFHWRDTEGVVLITCSMAGLGFFFLSEDVASVCQVCRTSIRGKYCTKCTGGK